MILNDVEPGARIGHGTKIWRFTHVESGAEIGSYCNIGQGCYVASGAIVGDNVKIQNGVSVFSGVHLEDQVFVGPGAVFTNILTPRAFIDRKAEFKKTWVQRGASIGAGAIIIAGVTIGAYAMVGAGALVTKDVPAYVLVCGNPARICGKVNERGEAIDG